MNKFNIFANKESPLFPFRWFIVFAALLGGLLLYSDGNGWRLLSARQQQWSASGQRGYHK